MRKVTKDNNSFCEQSEDDFIVKGNYKEADSKNTRLSGSQWREDYPCKFFWYGKQYPNSLDKCECIRDI